ncbi:hypothetical protein [Methylobacterium sp. Leaf466]|uniref:hypothetical protein n=1 Tax=Methylobacterium sp. Leaf466 TaxID=1736386 RepID=UPI0006FB889E|nr:hypothetical protein [Methylobacterium sp. Leaf466]KQT77698.1 hypothetical protein ASG59_10135 [Methylobacterium sp. Leaf466]
MRFYVDHDLGHAVRGWVVPDNPTAIGRIAVVIEGERVAEIPTRVTDDAIRAAGWHATGQCVFVVEEAEFPGLAQARRVEIYDVETNVLVYRRAPHPNVVRKKVVLVNTSIHPETVIETALFDHFQQSYFGVGRFSEEVARVLFESPWMTSSFQSGAIILPRYEGFLQGDDTLTTLLVHDPFIEMATRLLWLQDRAVVAADPRQRWRLGSVAEAAEYVAGHALDDAKSLKRLFRMLPEPAYHLLFNPLTRLCGTKLPDDRVHPGNSIVAIEVLSRVGIVGHRRFFKAFMTTLYDRLGILEPVPTPAPIPDAARALAERLRAVKLAEDMLVFDIAMSDAVLNAVSKGWNDS